MITSNADVSNTKSFCDKFPELSHNTLGKTGLTVSSCGFGSYRVDYRVKEHSEALEYAMLNGINLIDTSSNYSDGGSEILIGRVVKKLIDENKIKREEIVIVSKGGYIQGKNFDIASKKIEEDSPYPEVVEYTEKLWHCIHPDFLKDQITASLERLDMETIDVFLLHNPEYFLDSPYAGTLTLDELRHEYYSRIKKAFEYLEIEVENGRIGCYGISSNSFVANSDEQTFTSLSMCYKIAERINPNYNFKVIQFPFNLFERGAIANKNQEDDTKTLIEYAREKDFGVLINRPLNAILGKSLRRLADFDTEEKYINIDEAQIIAEINLLDSMEEDFLNEHLKSLELEPKISDAVNAFLKAGQLLKEN